MEFASYMQVTGVKQGAIAGSSLRRNREGLIALHSFQHEVLQPAQSSQNLAKSPVGHQPIVLCKEIDKSTPSLYRAQLEKEALQVELSWYRFNDSGVESLFYQISLSNGFIVKLESWMPEATVERNDQTRFLETLSIAYEEITWSYGPDGDASFSANWREG